MNIKRITFMLLFAVLLLVVSLSLPAFAFEVEQENGPVVVCEELKQTTELRSSPDSNAQFLGTYVEGTVVDVLEIFVSQGHVWCKVQVLDLEGKMHEGYMQDIMAFSLDTTTTPTAAPTNDPDDTFTQDFSITSVDIFELNGSWIGEIAFKNATGVNISEFTLLFEFYDEQGNRVFEYTNNLEGYLQEAFTDTYDLSSPLSDLEASSITQRYSVPTGADSLRVAVQEFVTQNGDVVHLHENQLVWYGSDGYQSDIPNDMTWYKVPSDEQLSADTSIFIGFASVPLYQKDAQYYQYQNGGYWIASVELGSPADMVGLLTGDVIISVNGNTVTPDNYAMDWAKNNLAAGETVIVIVERNGLIYEGVLSTDPNVIVPLTRNP